MHQNIVLYVCASMQLGKIMKLCTVQCREQITVINTCEVSVYYVYRGLTSDFLEIGSKSVGRYVVVHSQEEDGDTRPEKGYHLLTNQHTSHQCCKAQAWQQCK